jgi:hypothetical protein
VTGVVITFKQIFILVKLIKTIQKGRWALAQILALVKVQFIILIFDEFSEVFDLLDVSELFVLEFIQLNLKVCDFLDHLVVLLFEGSSF